MSVALPNCPCTLNARVGLAELILYVNLVPSFIPITEKEKHNSTDHGICCTNKNTVTKF